MQTNSPLHEQTVLAVANERRSTHRVIALLKENNARRLYAEMAYPSLFAYVHECLGYSESQAYERVKACELAGRVPENEGACKGTFELHDPRGRKSFDSTRHTPANRPRANHSKNKRAE